MFSVHQQYYILSRMSELSTPQKWFALLTQTDSQQWTFETLTTNIAAWETTMYGIHLSLHMFLEATGVG